MTPYQRLKAARDRKRRGLVAVTIPSTGEVFNIPADRLDDLRAWVEKAAQAKDDRNRAT